jgi:hypothetical protein
MPPPPPPPHTHTLACTPVPTWGTAGVASRWRRPGRGGCSRGGGTRSARAAGGTPAARRTRRAARRRRRAGPGSKTCRPRCRPARRPARGAAPRAWPRAQLRPSLRRAAGGCHLVGMGGGGGGLPTVAPRGSGERCPITGAARGVGARMHATALQRVVQAVQPRAEQHLP